MSVARKPVRSVLRAAAVIESIGGGAKGVSAIAGEIGLPAERAHDRLHAEFRRPRRFPFLS